MSTETCADIIVIKKVLWGNGSTGLVKRVEDHHDYITGQKGALRTIGWLLGFFGFAEMILLLRVFHVI